MTAERQDATAPGYPARLLSLVWIALARLVRSPAHSRRAEAGRRWARHTLQLTAALSVLVVALMYALDAAEIGWMPARGTAGLWPIRIVTDFGKSTYVLSVLGALLIAIALAAPALRPDGRNMLIRFGTRVQFVFLAVLVPVLAGEIIKWIVGRGRPFVGGEANAFNFSHFAGTEAYASFPSGHAVTACALAFAVSAVWPRARAVMIGYAVAILLSRLVLLAHHPSDVTAGALTGVIGAMFVRYWFAARRLGFTIGSDGAIRPLSGPPLGRLKGVARNAFAP